MDQHQQSNFFTTVAESATFKTSWKCWLVMQKLAILIKSAYTPACCMLQAMFAHGAGWAINITTFKYGESQQRVRAKSLSLGIIKRPSGLALRWLPDMPYGSDTQSNVRVVKQKIVWCGAAGINNLLRFFLVRLCFYIDIFSYICIIYYHFIFYCMKLLCLPIKWWRWSSCSEVAGQQSRFSVVKIFFIRCRIF